MLFTGMCFTIEVFLLLLAELFFFKCYHPIDLAFNMNHFVEYRLPAFEEHNNFSMHSSFSSNCKLSHCTKLSTCKPTGRAQSGWTQTHNQQGCLECTVMDDIAWSLENLTVHKEPVSA